MWCIYKTLTNLYFYCSPFKIKIKILNLKITKTVVLKTWEYNTSYIKVHIIMRIFHG